MINSVNHQKNKIKYKFNKIIPKIANLIRNID